MQLSSATPAFSLTVINKYPFSIFRVLFWTLQIFKMYEISIMIVGQNMPFVLSGFYLPLLVFTNFLAWVGYVVIISSRARWDIAAKIGGDLEAKLTHI